MLQKPFDRLAVIGAIRRYRRHPLTSAWLASFFAARIRPLLLSSLLLIALLLSSLLLSTLLLIARLLAFAPGSLPLWFFSLSLSPRAALLSFAGRPLRTGSLLPLAWLLALLPRTRGSLSLVPARLVATPLLIALLRRLILLLLWLLVWLLVWLLFWGLVSCGRVCRPGLIWGCPWASLLLSLPTFLPTLLTTFLPTLLGASLPVLLFLSSILSRAITAPSLRGILAAIVAGQGGRFGVGRAGRSYRIDREHLPRGIGHIRLGLPVVLGESPVFQHRSSRRSHPLGNEAGRPLEHPRRNRIQQRDTTLFPSPLHPGLEAGAGQRKIGVERPQSYRHRSGRRHAQG